MPFTKLPKHLKALTNLSSITCRETLQKLYNLQTHSHALDIKTGL